MIWPNVIGRLFRATKKRNQREEELQRQSITRHDLGNELVARAMELEECKYKVALLERKLEVKLAGREQG